jgi:hypothetical protein
MADEIDLTNRDPNQLNAHIQVSFDDVLAEPEGAHSMDCVWTNSYKCFTCGLGCCYKFITFFTGICIALAWGCLFALITYFQVWIWIPAMRAQSILLGGFSKVWKIYLGAFVVPYFETIGMLFSRIHVTSSTGQPPVPIGHMPGDKPAPVTSFK